MQTNDLSSITIRKLPPEVKQGLRLRAAQHGHSMEEEARQILGEAVAPTDKPQNAYEALRQPFEEAGVFLPDAFEVPKRTSGREPIDF